MAGALHPLRPDAFPATTSWPAKPRDADRGEVRWRSRCALASSIMHIPQLVQAAVALPTVRDDRRAGLDTILDERMQRGRRRITHNLHSASSKALRFQDVHCYGSQGLLATSTAPGEPWLKAANVGLVHFHDPGKTLSSRPHQHRAQPVQHGPSRLVGTDLQRTLDAQSRNAVLAADEQPTGHEPDRQRRSSPVEDRARCNRRAASTGYAHHPTVAQPFSPPHCGQTKPAGQRSHSR